MDTIDDRTKRAVQCGNDQMQAVGKVPCHRFTPLFGWKIAFGAMCQRPISRRWP